MDKNFYGCWPTMITPFTEDNRIDFKAVREITEWFISRGCDGIFAVCQSSEMFFLSEQEKLDLAAAVKEAAAGRVKVIASGHTAAEPAKQIEELGKMAETGVEAVVLVSNRLAKENEGEDVFVKNFENIKRQLPHVTFGMYECPYPYLRLLKTDFLKSCAENKSLVFLKDVCCSKKILEERISAIRGFSLALFNANTATLLDSLIAGADGYNGVMGNFHIDIYKWLYTNFKQDPELAREVSDFLTIAAVCEARAYPMSAKYHFAATGIPMGITTRAKDEKLLNENARHEIDSLIRLENKMRAALKL
ncbi:MAG: dihydrodipicolinate synthase family protein [Spirochaetales bacterium]|jgi:4-hydroxy-tetrahydrodipicolinate synthase|nr:dihydrodipicolinate synthase family protein [Spirochaetales bacterium]